MNDYLLQIYIERLSKDDIKTFAKSKGITLESRELDITFEYLKNHWRTFYYGNPKPLLEELKTKLKDETYCKIEALYMQAKEKLME
ncbi:MAG: hypothetical protein WC343_08460 [Bacilli bacterium]|jgi:hypothetical protein